MGVRLLPGLREAITGKDLRSAVEARGGGVEGKVISSGAWTQGYSVRTWGTEGRADNWDMATVVTQGFERSIWVFRCVQKMSGDQSSLPFRFGRGIGTDDEETLEDHPLYRVLNKRANPLETGKQFRKRLSGQVLLSKRGAFVEVTRSRLGTITRLDLLAPDRCRPIPDPRGDYLSHFEFIRSDGAVREIDPEKIRWIRDPHPTDPFSGVTPLEAAGISVELDFLMRVYNVTFLKNDGKPGGVVSIDADTMTDQQIARVEAKLRPGPENAGHTALVGTGPGGMNYVDLATKPRDMAYQEATQNAKTEILAAFGIGESLLGNAADRTFDNAEQERFNYWAESELPHLDLIASAFADDVDGDDWEPYFDTTRVDALDLPRRQKRSEAREEVDKGLRSIDEYRPLAGLDPVGNAQTRALWVSPAKAPIPTRDEDAAALGADQGAAGGQMPPGAPGQDGTAGGGSAADAVQAAHALDQPGGGSAADAVAAAQSIAGGGQHGSAAEAVQAAHTAEDTGGRAGAAAAVVKLARQATERKTLQPGGAPTAQPAGITFDPGDDEEARTQLAVAAALDALLTRQLGVITARLQSPKTRRGTRFWQERKDLPADSRVGDAPLDAGRVVDAQRWQQDTQDTVAPVVHGAAGAAALALMEAFTAPDADRLFLLPAAAFAGARASMAGTAIAVEAMLAWVGRVRQRIDAEAASAGSMDDVVAAVRDEYGQRAHDFAQEVAQNVAHTSVVGARDEAADTLTSGDTTAITRTWLTRSDALVRPSHAAVAGQKRRAGDPFVVGGTTLRYPGDPFGAVQEVANCRCRLYYASAPGARFTVASGEST